MILLNTVLPVFAIILAGFLAARYGLLGAASSEALNAFVYAVALPPLMFLSMAKVSLDEILNWPFIAAYSAGMLIVFLLAVVVARIVFPNRMAALSLHGYGAIFGNSGYMGIPLFLAAFGAEGALPAAIVTVLQTALVTAIVILLVEMDMQAEAGPVRALMDATAGLVKNPLVMAPLAGILVSAFEIPIPRSVETFLSILGDAAGPCALFALGLFLYGKPLKAGIGEVGWLTFCKLLLQPLVTWVIAVPVMGLPPFWAHAAVILAALPTGATVFVIAQRYGVYVQRSSALILVSTVLSLASLSVLFLVLGFE
jgi:malonate transporter and related proteins